MKNYTFFEKNIRKTNSNKPRETILSIHGIVDRTSGNRPEQMATLEQELTAHTNAEIARTLDRLEQDDAKLTDGRRLELDIPSWVEAERAKLKEVK